MADRVKPEDQLFLVAYPYFNVNGNSLKHNPLVDNIFIHLPHSSVVFLFLPNSEMLVVEELYKEAVVNTDRKLIIFNGELDRIRSGCILFFFSSNETKYNVLQKREAHVSYNEKKKKKDYPKFFYPKLGALTETLLPKMETVYYIHNFKGQKGGVLFRFTSAIKKKEIKTKLKKKNSLVC